MQKKIPFNEWLIKKDTEQRFKEKLVEAAKDEVIHEYWKTLQCEHLKREEDVHRLQAWDDQKRQASIDAKSKQEVKERRQVLIKQRTVVEGDKVFREWLRKDLGKLREKQLEIRAVKQEKKDEEDRKESQKEKIKERTAQSFEAWTRKKIYESRQAKKDEIDSTKARPVQLTRP